MLQLSKESGLNSNPSWRCWIESYVYGTECLLVVEPTCLRLKSPFETIEVFLAPCRNRLFLPVISIEALLGVVLRE